MKGLRVHHALKQRCIVNQGEFNDIFKSVMYFNSERMFDEKTWV